MNALIWIVVFTTAALFVAHRITQLRLLFAGWKGRITLGIWLLPVIVVLLWWIDLPLSTPAAALCFTITGVLVWRRRMTGATAVIRLGDRARRKSGVASTLDIWRHGSRLSLLAKAGVLRPSMADLTRRELLRIPATEFGARVARVGFLRWIWVSVEMVTLIVGGPRKGKSGYLATRIVDAPGAVLATSTRSDLYRITAAERIAKGSAIYVFNAVGEGGIPTSLPFDPLTGCDDPTVAYERASDMTGSSGGGQASGDREYWDSEGRRFLSVLLHAAALGRNRGDGCTMTNVEEWRGDPERYQGTIASYLRGSSQPGMDTLIDAFIKLNERTRTSITQAAARATAWLISPAACAAAKDGARIDVAGLLETRASIYLIGAKETQSEALVAALVGCIAREARRLAGLQPGGRLDPPLAMALDEAGLLAPPLSDWTADMGGRGITITAAFQSRAQMLECWSPAVAGVTLNNAATVMLFGGCKDPDDLEVWSRLAGERDEVVATNDKHGKAMSSTGRKVPVFSPPQISNLRAATKRRPAQVIVFQDGMPAALANAQMLWQRRSGWMWRLLDAFIAWRNRCAESARVAEFATPIGTRTPGSTTADDIAA